MLADNEWAIGFYKDARGNTPAREFLSAPPDNEQAVVLRVFALLRSSGPALGMPHVRPIGGLWEVRAGANRFFYFAFTGRRFIVVHGYRKKGQKAPKQEIQTAQRRMSDFLERQR
jgi:phage-related protein